MCALCACVRVCPSSVFFLPFSSCLVCVCFGLLMSMGVVLTAVMVQKWHMCVFSAVFTRIALCAFMYSVLCVVCCCVWCVSCSVAWCKHQVLAELDCAIITANLKYRHVLFGWQVLKQGLFFWGKKEGDTLICLFV